MMIRAAASRDSRAQGPSRFEYACVCVCLLVYSKVMLPYILQ